MTTHKRMIGILLPALILVHTHEVMPLNSVVRFAGKSLVAATIIGIVSLQLFIKKDDVKEDTKTGKKRAFYEQLGQIILGGMGTTAAFDYFAHAKNEEKGAEETLIKDGELPEVIEVSRYQSSDKQLSAETMSKELRDAAGTVAAVSTLAAFGSTLAAFGAKIVSWPLNHWPLKRSKKPESPAHSSSEQPSAPHSSDQTSQIPLQVSVDPSFRTQLDEFRTQLANLAASHNEANISEEERQELINAFDQRLNKWLEEKQEILNLLEGIYVGLLNGGTVPENLRNQDAIRNIMALIGEDVKQQLGTQREQIGNLLEEHTQKVDVDVRTTMKQLDTQNKTAREGTRQTLNYLTHRLTALEAFKRETEETQQLQLRTSSSSSWNPLTKLFGNSDDSDQND